MDLFQKILPEASVVGEGF